MPASDEPIKTKIRIADCTIITAPTYTITPDMHPMPQIELITALLANTTISPRAFLSLCELINIGEKVEEIFIIDPNDSDYFIPISMLPQGAPKPKEIYVNFGSSTDYVTNSNVKLWYEYLAQHGVYTIIIQETDSNHDEQAK